MALFHDERVRLADDQFEKLVELLTPGYEMVKAYQAEMAASAARRAEYEQNDAAKSQQQTPGTDDASKSESNPMDPGPQSFRKSAPPPDFDDPSKQGSG